MHRKYWRPPHARGAAAAENRRRCDRRCPILDAIGAATKDGRDVDLDDVDDVDDGDADVRYDSESGDDASGETVWRHIRHSRKRPARPDSCASVGRRARSIAERPKPTWRFAPRMDWFGFDGFDGFE